jgi:hypothetical protein
MLRADEHSINPFYRTAFSSCPAQEQPLTPLGFAEAPL